MNRFFEDYGWKKAKRGVVCDSRGEVFLSRKEILRLVLSLPPEPSNLTIYKKIKEGW